MINLNVKYTMVKDGKEDVMHLESSEWGVATHLYMQTDVNGYNVKLCNIPKCGQSTQMTQKIDPNRIQSDRCIAFLRDPAKRFKSQLFNSSLFCSDYMSYNYDTTSTDLMHMLTQSYFVNAYPHEILEFLDITQMDLVFDMNTFEIQNPATYSPEWEEDFEEHFDKNRAWFEDTYQADIELYNSKILGV